ncbi:MAG: THUMP domain-containing class I SAM-dependent RNA methyltransferase, partial [Neglectibacter sp.]
ENFLHQEDEFPVSGSSLSSKLYSVPDCQAIIKKAVVERLKTKYHVSWFQETGPLHRIRFRLLKDEASVMLDTSGEGLHKRGYRRNSAEAPIKETLAACLVKLARVRPDGNFIDPFCGSGTLLIEAAMLAMNMAPGANRAFQAERWLDAQPKVWQAERERAVSLAKTDVAFRAVGYDIDPAAVSLSLENAKKAGVIAHVRAEVRDVRQFSEEGPFGCVVCNPPYGERLLDLREAEKLYKVMGERFERRKGWSYSVITPDEEFENMFGRKADKRRKLYNGMIKCQYYQYFK